MKNGNGKLTSANGDEYTGSFKDELFHGKGTFVYVDGAHYKGEYKNNL
tara:strand:- start:175 stop:318 length:144 start_codon:yes stop_codon:yes gene_type:complete